MNLRMDVSVTVGYLNIPSSVKHEPAYWPYRSGLLISVFISLRVPNTSRVDRTLPAFNDLSWKEAKIPVTPKIIKIKRGENIPRLHIEINIIERACVCETAGSLDCSCWIRRPTW